MNNLLKECYETNGTDGIYGTYASLMSAISAINPISFTSTLGGTHGEKGATRIRPATPRVPSPGCPRTLDTGQAILIDRILGKLGILRCTEEHVRERSVRTLSPLQIAAEIDAAKDRETAEEGPGSSRDGRPPEDEAGGRTESD